MVSVAAAESAKVMKAKKTSGPKKPRAHPPYLEMIKEAIVALKERSGSSQIAIAKFIEQKQKNLPPNFKKLLLVQLKKLVAGGKITKVKNSFKLSVAEKPKAAAATAVKKAAPTKKAVPAKSKTGASVKPKAATPSKAKKVAAKPKAVAKPKTVAKPKKAAKTAAVTTPGKKKVATPAAVKVKKVPMKAVKKPKSIKTPVKKVTAKKGKK
ncbi:histone H1-like [Cornus florida]|uniref:histone H1-like n=1 Tax=Cornus florida TaxID=4283 RepID=UPI00289EB974|nr:histone H1-like [Cornus florida]